MASNIIFVLLYHRHKLLDVIYVRITLTLKSLHFPPQMLIRLFCAILR
jgi:hypothetical protein